MACKKCSAQVEKLSGRGKFRFVASTPEVDCEGEIIHPRSFDRLGRVPVHVMHEGPVVGEAVLFQRGDITLADVTLHDAAAIQQVDSGELAQLSIGFERIESFMLENGVQLTTKIRIKEVSIVRRGCAVGATRIKAITRGELERAIHEGMREGLGTPAPSPTFRKDDIESGIRAALKREAHMAIYRATGSLTAFDAAQRP